MTLYPWPCNWFKLSSYDCLLSNYWPWCADQQDYYNSATSVIAGPTVMPSDRPKLSFGIDVILGDHVGAVRRPIRSIPVQNYIWGCSNDPTSDVVDIPSRPDTEQQQQQQQQQQQIVAQHPNRRKRSWSRAVFSNLQRKGLEKRFQVQKYITKPDRRQLAATLGLTDAQVKVWFQNRRMKWRHNQDRLKTIQGQSALTDVEVEAEEVLSASDDQCTH